MKNIVLTGCQGYVGAMITDQFLKDSNVDVIIGIDKDDYDQLFKKLLDEEGKKNITERRLFFIHKNLSDKSWIYEIDNICKERNIKIDSIIHTAWQIRAMYGSKGYAKTWNWNINGSDNLFDYTFNNNIPKLIHFSTVASYGSFETNSVNKKFIESDDFRSSDYIYAEEKKATEEHLQSRYLRAKNAGYKGQVVLVRPAAVSGPRGRYGRIRFGLQSNLQGKIKGGFIMWLIRLLTTFVPATSKWVRQFIHEDDVVDIIKMFAVENDNLKNDYDVFNICPEGESVFPSDMAKAVKKRIVWIYPWMARFAFFIFWHLTRGKVPTCRGSWRGYSYPIVVDGSKLTRIYDYVYKYSCKESFITKEGRYSFYVND